MAKWKSKTGQRLKGKEKREGCDKWHKWKRMLDTGLHEQRLGHSLY